MHGCDLVSCSELNGKELQGLTIQELQKLEELLQIRWATVSRIKVKLIRLMG